MKRGARKSSSRTTCLACGKPIKGKRSTIRLQITNEDPKLAQYSKRLGFTSISWHRGDKMEGVLHPRCFNIAKVVWQAAFNTRLVSPRSLNRRP